MHYVLLVLRYAVVELAQLFLGHHVNEQLWGTQF